MASRIFFKKSGSGPRWIYPCGEATLQELCTFLLKLRVISWEDGQSQACTSHLCGYQPTNFLMHNRGIIEPTSSEKEICVEYCQLNGALASDAYPMPRVNELIDKCGRSLDFTKGYWQMAFATSFGFYQFKVMPFGLQQHSSVPASYRCVSPGTGCCCLDDPCLRQQTLPTRYIFLWYCINHMQIQSEQTSIDITVNPLFSDHYLTTISHRSCASLLQTFCNPLYWRLQNVKQNCGLDVQR